MLLITLTDALKAQSFDFETWPPTEPPKIWRVNASRQLEDYVQPAQLPPFNELKRITVTLESIVINDKRDLFSRDAEVVIIARVGEGPTGSADPMLVDLAEVSERRAAVIKVPLIGPRYWTKVDSYDLRLEMWEVDKNKVSTALNGQQLQYGNVKQQLRALTGSQTLAAVTPQEAALTAVLQPILMAVVKHIEKPDKLFRSRVEFTTTPQPGGTAVIPLQTGRYVLEYRIPGRTNRPLAAGTRLRDDFSLDSPPSGGNISNYLVLNVKVDEAADGSAEQQEARSQLEEFRNRVRSNGASLLPDMLRRLLPGESPTDQLIAQLELNDLKKRYEVRQMRTPVAQRIKALEWFIDQVQDGTIPLGVSSSTPLFTSTQVRDATTFASELVVGAKPVLTSDEPKEVLAAWRGLVKSASAEGNAPRRVFVTEGTHYRVREGFDKWYFEQKLKPALVSVGTAQPLDPESVKRLKAAVRDFLGTIELTDPEKRLTAEEKAAVLEAFKVLFQDSDIQPPTASGSAPAQAQTYLEWLKNPNLHVEVATGGGRNSDVRLRAGDWVKAMLKHSDSKLTTLANQNTTGSAIPTLFNDVVRPILAAMASPDGPFATPESKQKLANWLKDHTDANLETDVSAWRTYFAQFENRLTARDIAGKPTIIKMDIFDARLRTVQRMVRELLDEGQNLTGVPLRNRLQPVTNIFQTASLTPQQESKLLAVFQDVGAVFTSKAQYLSLIDESQGGTFFVTFRDGQLFSGRPNYFSGPDIVASLQNFRRFDDNERDGQLRRAIAFITTEAGQADQQNRQLIYDMLTGPQGLTDFSAPDTERFNVQAWKVWQVDFRPTWHGEVGRYIKSNQPPIA
jgi:hypothetical protein